MTSPSIRRLLKESTDLHKYPSPYFTAGPVDESNLHDWHFTLAGPTSSPYVGGLYHGRITFPPTYPLRPPSFRFLTPSARFEVNREICLSISGHHEETWQPAWGVRTALLAIRSEIFQSESKGQVGGMEGSEGLRREYALASRGWICRECGENERVMRGVWERCKEVGVEVDESVIGRSENEKLDEMGQMDASHSVELDSAEVSAPVQSQSQPEAEATVPAPAPAPAAVGIRPTPTVPSPNTMPTNSPWLDRAIVGVVIALIILVLRRVTDADKL